MFTLALPISLKSSGFVCLFGRRAAGRAFVACVLATIAGLVGGPPASGNAEGFASKVLVTAPTAANTLTVTSTDDSGAGSLRQAIADAAPGDTINFNLPANSTITLTGVELAINKNLSISGPGALALAVSGDGKSRVFQIASDATVHISGLTIRNGSVFQTGTNPGDSSGGGILNSGTLTLTECTIMNNGARGGNFTGNGFGGGIDNFGDLTLTSSTISGNSARGGESSSGSGNGGGIYNRSTGKLKMTNCTISNNSASGGSAFGSGGGAFGGGINNQSSGKAMLANCMVSNNSVAGGRGSNGSSGTASGGGILNSGDFTLINSAVSNNSATGNGTSEGNASPALGGGIDNFGTLTLAQCAIRNNSIVGGNGRGSNGSAQGAGINNRPSGALMMTDSTVDGNSANAGGGFPSGPSALGGGINNSGALTLSNSAVSNNLARAGSGTAFGGGTASGGGINNTAILTLTNSTISNNSVKGGIGSFSEGNGGFGTGGGISSAGTLTLTNCTLTLNSASGGDAANGSKAGPGLGGGIYRSAGTAKPLNTIVAGNAVSGDIATTAGTDVSGEFASQGHNLVGRNDGAETSFPAGVPNASGDIVGTPAAPVDAKLDTLANNGGATQTHRPRPDSPALDAGDDSVLGPPLSLSTDQRGPGFPRLVNFKVDIGAVEVSHSTLQFAAGDFIVSEAVGTINITVTRVGNLSAGDLTVDYETSDGTASERSDYAAAFGTLRFAQGENSKTFSIFVTDDAFVEGDETVNLRLSDPVGDATLGGQVTSTLTIKDNDAAPPSSANPIDDAQFFVRQHYIDFLGREPDPAGLAFWAGQITSCGTDAQCRDARRVNVSAAFFLSIEFQETGGFAIRVGRAAFGKKSSEAATRIRLAEFFRDARQLGEGVIVGQGEWEHRLGQNKESYLNRTVNGADFTTRFPTAQTAAQYADALFSSAGVTPTAAERQSAIDAFGTGGAQGRAATLGRVAESASVRQAEFNSSFVLLQYFGYLRRNPSDAPDSSDDGYQFWLSKLNQSGGNFVGAEMVKAFLVASEYRQRFGQQ